MEIKEFKKMTIFDGCRLRLPNMKCCSFNIVHLYFRVKCFVFLKQMSGPHTQMIRLYTQIFMLYCLKFVLDGIPYLFVFCSSDLLVTLVNHKHNDTVYTACHK